MTHSVLSVRDLCRIGIFTAVTCLLSQIAVPLPFTPVPLSLGVAAVFLTGLLLEPRCAGLSQLCYLLLGAVGLPVFHNFQGGPAVLFGPTGGYLFVYPVMALAVSWTVNREGRVRLRTRAALSMGAGLLLCYLCGTLWLSFLTGSSFVHCLAMAVYPYVPLDLVKIALCALGGLPLRERLGRNGLIY